MREIVCEICAYRRELFFDIPPTGRFSYTQYYIDEDRVKGPVWTKRSRNFKESEDPEKMIIVKHVQI